MVYCEARIAALNGSLQCLQSKIDHELELPAPDADRLADFKHKVNHIRDEIDCQRIRLASAV